MSNTTIDRIRGINSGIAIKAPCRVRTTANITLSGLQTIDGVTLVADDRVLVMNQNTQSENGIYKASTGSWVREPDFDGNRDIVNGTLVYVTAGTLYSLTIWAVSSANPITIGTTSITFIRANIDPASVFSGTGYVKVSGGVYQTPSATVPLTDLATQAANTVLANATASIATPTAVALSASQLLGRGSTGNVAAITLGTNLSMSGTTLSASGLVLFNYITGLIPTAITSSSSTSCTVSISSGQAADSTNAVMQSGGSFSWSIANGNAANGYSGGTTLPNSSTIHFFIITNSSNSSAASFASNTLTPTLPSSHTGGYYRRIFSLFTNASGVLLGTVGSGAKAIEVTGGGVLFYYTTQILDINAQTPGTASRTLYTLSAPTGIKLRPIYRYYQNSLTAGQTIITSPDETDVAPAGVTAGNYYSYFTAAPGYDTGGSSTNGIAHHDGGVYTNTSAQIAIRANVTAPAVYWVTRGIIDDRRS